MTHPFQKAYKLRDTPLSSADISIFSPKISNLFISRNTDKDSNSFNFFESLKVIIINMVAISMMSVKLTTLGLLKIQVSRNKVYDFVFSVLDVNNNFLSRDSNYIVGMVM